MFWGGIDYKFRNNTEYPIRIDAYSDNGTVTISLYGTDTKDYYVEFESVHLATYPYDVVYEEMPADNEKGYKDGHVLTSPYTGYKSEGWAIKYSKETGEEKTIVFGLTGTGYFDMVAYQKFNDGLMSDYIPTDEERT